MGRMGRTMELNLAGRTGLVTGASSGIGRAIALGLAREGVRLVVTARRHELLEELADEVVEMGGRRPVVVAADLAASSAPAGIADSARRALGTVEILVNNAGEGGRLRSATSEEGWEAGMHLNFTVHRQLTGALLEQMQQNGWGRIVTIGAGGNPAKAALLQYTKNVASEAARHGVTANVIQPGKIMSEQVARRYPPDVRAAQAERDIAVGYFGEPEDIAYLACFLCSPLARYLTGAIVPVDGGLVRRR
ncbi:putative Short-chain dehydrogenase/reductase SDR [metagenome]|uniref:Putative Short-chain dehydrogenase/reductase SDR n=1 Tax=metagenome TaxID=256318 RepID=A0A2P2C928_9ZZZZ